MTYHLNLHSDCVNVMSFKMPLAISIFLPTNLVFLHLLYSSLYGNDSTFLNIPEMLSFENLSFLCHTRVEMSDLSPSEMKHKQKCLTYSSIFSHLVIFPLNNLEHSVSANNHGIEQIKDTKKGYILKMIFSREHPLCLKELRDPLTTHRPLVSITTANFIHNPYT